MHARDDRVDLISAGTTAAIDIASELEAELFQALALLARRFFDRIPRVEILCRTSRAGLGLGLIFQAGGNDAVGKVLGGDLFQ